MGHASVVNNLKKPSSGFYCCYLLRSTIRHASLYIGSTPDPQRRLAQHNGLLKGGAVRTSRSKLRPWEMVLLVHGFPSKTAALQLEWAWQNTHVTRHISTEDRVTKRTQRTRTTKTGKTHTRCVKAGTSLKDRLVNLPLLLRATEFEKMPLQIKIFDEGVFQAWNKYVPLAEVSKISVQLVHAPSFENCIRGSLKSLPSSEAQEILQIPSIRAIWTLVSRYQPSKTDLETVATLLKRSPGSTCSICSVGLQELDSTLLACPHDDCSSVNHTVCIAEQFRAAASFPQNSSMAPGRCPSCRKELDWDNLMRDQQVKLKPYPEPLNIKCQDEPLQPCPELHETSLDDWDDVLVVD